MCIHNTTPVQRSCQPNLGCHRSEPEDKRLILGDFPTVKCSVGYRGWAVVVSAEFALVAVSRKSRLFPTCTCISPCPAATMKRVADSQLTKDSDDGDNGPEVNS